MRYKFSIMNHEYFFSVYRCFYLFWIYKWGNNTRKTRFRIILRLKIYITFSCFFFFLFFFYFFLCAFCIVYWIKLQNIDGNRIQLNEILVLLAKYETTNNFDLDPSKSPISIFYIIKIYWLMTNVSSLYRIQILWIEIIFINM